MSRPYVKRPSQFRFYRPPTLESDFDNFLDGQLPNQVMDFTLLHDWYAQFEDGYEPTIIRGELYPDATKSRYENTDSNMNFRASLSSGIHKGDMIIASNNQQPYLLDWEVHLESNNAPSRALRCNFYLSISRYMDDVVDERGYVIEEKGWTKIVDAIPCNAYRYDGRPEFSAASGTPGITANAYTILSVQYNDQTKLIRVDDTFQWGDDTYEIVDVSRVGLALDDERGCLTLRCRHTAGGFSYD